MATMLQENTLALTGMVRRWDRWRRLRQMLLWLPLSLVPGLVIGLVLAAVSRMRPLLMPQQIAQATGVLVALGAVIFMLAVWLWRRSALKSARHFDGEFGLYKRISTALELSAGAIRSNDELIQRQIEDARARASAIRVREQIPLAVRSRDWLIVIALTVALALLLLLPNPQVEALRAASIQQAAIDQAADQLRQTTQDIAADPSLGNEQRQTLLEQLQNATNTLQQPNVSPQEALAAVSDVQSSLQSTAESLSQQAQADQAALQQAADALHRTGQPGTQQTGDQQSQPGTGSAMQQVTQDLNQIAQDAQSMTPDQQQQAQQALQDAAQALQTANPDAAASLQQAAQQMQQGNDPTQQIQQAQQQMQQQAQQADQQQQSAQQMNDAASQAQQSADQISQAQQADQQQSGQQPGQQSGQQQSQQQNQPGQQPGQGQGQQAGQQPGQAEAQQTGGQGAVQSQQAQVGMPGQPGQQPGQQGVPREQPGSNSAGDAPGSEPSQTDNAESPEQAQDMNNANNNPDGQGVGQYEAVNVPRRIGPQANDGNNIQLNPDASNTPVQEGNYSQNPDGQVTVPYDQVYGDYADAANQALDSDYVPLGLRDVVRDYFTSLEPHH